MLRIEGYRPILDEIQRVRADVVINAVGKTYSKNCGNIDGCLDEPEETIKSNVLAVAALTRACEKAGCFFVHLSSGCVFNGYPENRPNGFSESDIPEPVSYYSEKKLEAELIAKTYDKSLILRLRLPFDGSQSHRNLFTKLIKNFEGGYIINAPNSMTCVDDFLKVIKHLVIIKATGVFNVTNPVPMNHFQVTMLMRECGVIDKFPHVRWVSPKEFDNLKITRDKRSNCILDTRKLEATGFKMRITEEAMVDCLVQYKRNQNST